MCRCELDHALQKRALVTAVDPATTATLLLTGELPGIEELVIAVGLAVPSELDQFTEEDLLRWMHLAAVSKGTKAL